MFWQPRPALKTSGDFQPWTSGLKTCLPTRPRRLLDGGDLYPGYGRVAGTEKRTSRCHFIVQSNQQQPERAGVIRRLISTVLLNFGAGLIVLGGVGDLLVLSPPELWSQPLGQPVGSLPPAVARLLICFLHALGSALIASGIAVLFLVNGPLRRGERWIGVGIALVVVLADGMND